MLSSKMLALLSVLLLSSHVLPLVQSTSCDDKTEYLYDQTCCKKCKPGEYVLENCKYQSATQCATCGNGFFTNDYNSYFNWCPDCRTCTKDHMTYKKNCTTTSNAVCTCVEGYRCTDSDCQACEKIQTATVPSAITTTIPPTHDIMWISVSLCCACVCVCVLLTCFLLISRNARQYGWIMPASPDKSNSGSSQCTEEEEVPMPVQEMCGKTEKLEDV
ncbi:tumor necrosis factor receptor superfamily member 5 isoform X3 [Carassius auratus]|uniref:Tumor necrosis factor receptor superfamily member 5 isoform X3 n=1 Tax=Carassius auratus TaxID=7957 RepID=A0A6P6R4W6_CARAU|nr:tumor necrosis factor receptor superfamily member 5-like isoform X3 [Carassius auratus]